ncbi:MAG TPA: FAD-binding protein, partial [Anaerovoracaceae bacterium]|nr:FAD-binding protein [Anaerovoracaceae bacterium]
IVKEGYDYINGGAGESKYIKANKGVVLAAGGFGSDVSFRKKFDDRLDDKIDSTNKPFATAEVIKKAMEIGADTVGMEYIQLGPWASPDEKGYGAGPMFSEYIVFQKGVIVNPATGKRFINELVDRKILSDNLLSIGHPCIGIADERAVIESGWDISKAINKKVVIKFDSLEELSCYYNIKYKNLLDTIDSFNFCIDNNLDDEYKKTLISECKRIDKSPYYAIRLWPKVHFTMGGLKINEKAQVINVNDKPINKLYAAGEITGGVHGASRLGSCSITDCFVFGAIAGRSIMN